jgi:hypothetical protein
MGEVYLFNFWCFQIIHSLNRNQIPGVPPKAVEIIKGMSELIPDFLLMIWIRFDVKCNMCATFKNS